MKLLSLSVERFAGLKEKTISFSEGVNLFYGENEAGKSTVCECLLYVFYGFADKKQRLRFCPWDADYVSATLTLEMEGTRYRLERHTTKDGADESRIFCIDKGEPIQTDLAPWEFFLGIPLPLYRRSAFVGQTDGARIEGRPIADCMENLLLSADETVDVSHALKQLDDARIPLLYKRQNGGEIFVLRNEIDRLQADLQTAQEEQKTLLDAEYRLRKEQAEYATVQADIRTQKELLAFYEEGKRRTALIQLNAKKQRAQESARELAQMEQLHTQNGFFPDRAYITQLESLRNPYEEAQRRCDSLEEQSKALEAQLTSADIDTVGLRNTHKRTKRTLRQTGIGMIATFFLAAYLLIASLYSFAKEKTPYFLLALFVLTTLSCLFFFLRCKKSRNGLQALYHTWQCQTESDFFALLQNVEQESAIRAERKNEYNRIVLALQEAKQDYKEQHEAVETALARWNKAELVPTIELATQVLMQHLTLSHKAELAASELQGYQILLAVSAEEMERFHSSPYDFQRYEACNGDTIKAELATLHQKGETLATAMVQAEKEIAVLRATLSDPALLQEKMQEKQVRLTQLQKAHDAYVLAYTALSQARDNIHDGLSPRLTEQAGRYLARFTAGRYENLQVSKDLRLEFSQKEGQRTHSDEFLSASTQDSAYFSLRLALANTFFGRPLPLIFDESFSRMDDQRYTNAITLLKETAKEPECGQILLFTSQKRDVTIAQTILNQSAIIL